MVGSGAALEALRRVRNAGVWGRNPLRGQGAE